MERTVVSLETAKKLKAAGFPQIGLDRVWTTSASGAAAGRFTLHYVPNTGEDYAAPTAQEIADQLPNKPDFPHDWHLVVERESDGNFSAYMNCDTEYDGNELEGYSLGDTLAEALAALWLKLYENANI